MFDAKRFTSYILSHHDLFGDFSFFTVQQFSSGVYVRYLAKGVTDNLQDIDIAVDGTTNVSFCLGRCIGYLENNIKNLLPASFQEQEVFLCDLAPNLDVVPVIKSSFGVQQSVRRRTIFRALQFLADTRGFV